MHGAKGDAIALGRIGPVNLRLVRLALVLALALLLGPAAGRIIDSVRIALETSAGDLIRPLLHLSPQPRRSVVEMTVGQQRLRADVYDPDGLGRKPGMILVNGVVREGRRYPPLVNLAYAMSRSGVVVMVPDLLGYPGLRLVPEDVDVLARSFRDLAAMDNVDPARIGFVGFSVGGSLAFVAAAEPSIAADVSFVAMVGPYSELRRIVSASTTGMYEQDGKFVQFTPDSFVWGVTRNTLIATLTRARDRAVLNSLFGGPRPAPRRAALERFSRDDLSPEGRAVYDVFANRDPALVGELLGRLPEGVQSGLRRLSPAEAVGGIRARVLMLHERGDPYFPSWESESLAPALQAGNVALTLSTLVEHAELRTPPPTPGNLFGFYLPEGWKLGSFIHSTLAAVEA